MTFEGQARGRLGHRFFHAKLRNPRQGDLSPDFIKKGLKYISASIDKVAVIRINIDHISGKAKR